MDGSAITNIRTCPTLLGGMVSAKKRKPILNIADSFPAISQPESSRSPNCDETSKTKRFDFVNTRILISPVCLSFLIFLRWR